MAANRGAVVVGDVFVDYIGDLTAAAAAGGPPLPTDPAADLHAFGPVTTEVGGAGVQFAVAARAAGFEPVTLIGKIGGDAGGRPDEAGVQAREYLRAHGVEPLLSVQAGGATGRAAILYVPPNRRIMVSDPLANTTLVPTDIGAAARAAAGTAAFAHISGFLLLQPGRRQAAICVLEAAQSGGATTALDLVPHEIYRYLSYRDLVQCLAGTVDWLVVELPTARRLLGADGAAATAEATAEAVLEALARDFPSVALYPDPGCALVSSRGEMAELRFEYTPGSRSRGQSARAQASLFAKHV